MWCGVVLHCVEFVVWCGCVVWCVCPHIFQCLQLDSLYQQIIEIAISVHSSVPQDTMTVQAACSFRTNAPLALSTTVHSAHTADLTGTQQYSACVCAYRMGCCFLRRLECRLLLAEDDGLYQQATSPCFFHSLCLSLRVCLSVSVPPPSISLCLVSLFLSLSLLPLSLSMCVSCSVPHCSFPPPAKRCDTCCCTVALHRAVHSL